MPGPGCPGGGLRPGQSGRRGARSLSAVVTAWVASDADRPDTALWGCPLIWIQVARLRAVDRSVGLRDSRESVKGRFKPLDCGPPGTLKSIRIGELSPVVGMGDACLRWCDRLKFPPPQVTWWLLTWLSGPPCNQPTLLELDYMILPNVPSPRHHGEHATDRRDALARSGLDQVVVAVPARLLGWVGNKVENRLSACRNLAACSCHAWTFFLTHLPIQPQGTQVRPAQPENDQRA